MAVILGNLSLIRFDPHVDTESRSKLSNAATAILRARDLTAQLLTFSRGGAPVREAAPISEVVRESVMSRYEEFGFSGCVKKPCSMDELARTVGDLIQRRRRDQLRKPS